MTSFYKTEFVIDVRQLEEDMQRWYYRTFEGRNLKDWLRMKENSEQYAIVCDLYWKEYFHEYWKVERIENL